MSRHKVTDSAVDVSTSAFLRILERAFPILHFIVKPAERIKRTVKRGENAGKEIESSPRYRVEYTSPLSNVAAEPFIGTGPAIRSFFAIYASEPAVAVEIGEADVAILTARIATHERLLSEAKAAKVAAVAVLENSRARLAELVKRSAKK